MLLIRKFTLFLGNYTTNLKKLVSKNGTKMVYFCKRIHELIFNTMSTIILTRLRKKSLVKLITFTNDILPLAKKIVTLES